MTDTAFSFFKLMTVQSTLAIENKNEIMFKQALSGYAASKHALHGFLYENKNEVLEAILGWIKDTNLRGNAFGPDGNVQKRPPKQHSKESIDLDWCVSKILRAIKKDWRTTYIPLTLRLIPFFKAFWRWYLESSQLYELREEKAERYSIQ